MTSQAAFRTALLDPEAPTPAGLVTPEGATATRRFDVYRNNVAVSLAEALETAFPVLHKLVGDAFFRAMAGVYLRRHPPRSPLMMGYGAELPDFLQGFAPAQSLPYLPDVARLELALGQAYHAADATPVDPAALAAMPEHTLPRLRIGFAPALRLVASDHPVHGIWAANAVSGGKPVPRAETALVTRPGFDPMVDALTPDQGRVLAPLVDGATLGDALHLGGAGVDVGPLLAVLLQRGAITSLTVEEPGS
jgi:hypothetical protein